MSTSRTMIAPAASGAAGVIHLAGAVALRGADAGAVVALLGGVGLLQLGWAVAASGSGLGRGRWAAGAALGAVAVATWGVLVVRGGSTASQLGPAGAVAALLGLVVAVVCARALLVDGGGAVRSGVASYGAIGLVAAAAMGSVVALPGSVERARAPEPPPEQVVRVGGLRPFDPAEPIDLSGTPGATDAEQAAAEGLLAQVLEAAPRYASTADAEAAGYRSIGDAFTGEEHYIDWAAVEDPETLDPTRPEALVYDVGDDDERTLIAVMFVLPPGTRLEDAPEVGGPLTIWHRHGDLCVGDAPDGVRTVVAITDALGRCPDGSEEIRPMPTLHTWVVAHPCGPFSELEGVGSESGAAGSAGGEACRHRHGS